MKKLLKKLLLFIIPVLIYVGAAVYIDAYNVFHVENIRFTRVTPNQNFIKTKYILKNKDKFNAYVFGSSRAANLPVQGLPTTLKDGTELKWYNMTYAMGCVEENYHTIKDMVDGGVHIDMVVMLMDEISMWRNADYSTDECIFTSYQTYKLNPLAFYYSYIKQKPLLDLIPEIFSDKICEFTDKASIRKKELFYSYGVDEKNTDMNYSLGEEMMDPEHSVEYTDKSTSVQAMKELAGLCLDNDIRLIVLATPLLESTYQEAVDNGYLEFLRDMAEVTDYYCFSGLNEYTQEAGYYFDASHFKPYLGYEMEKIVFGDGDSSEDGGMFGVYVTKDNADEVIGMLKEELE